MGASAALCLWFSRHTTFSIDEVTWFSISPHTDLRSALEPYNGHLILTARLAYAAILNMFGVGYLPFRLLVVAAVVLTSGLFFEFARRRVGSVVALAPTLVLLFYGPAAAHMLTGNGFTVVLPLAAGIGALLALERQDRVGDIVACTLLCLAVATYSVGIPFVAGAAVLVLIGGDRWRRAWVFLVPAMLYAAWLLWSRHQIASTEGDTHLSNVVLAPTWAFKSLATVAASLLGLNRASVGTGWRYALAVIALAAVGWRLWRGGTSRSVWAVMAIPATLWIIGALAASAPLRVPESPRYIYPTTIAVLLVAVEAGRGVRIGRRGIALLYGLVALGLASNLLLLRSGGKLLRDQAAARRATLSALEIGNGREGPLIAKQLGVTGIRHTVDASYIQAVREFGSPAYSLADMQAQPEPVRERVDADLADSLRIHTRPADAPVSGCDRAEGDSVRLPPRGAVLMTKGPRASVMLRRFGAAFTVTAGALEPGVPTVLSLPRDEAPQPWYALTSTGPLSICRWGG
jgi:hypothetical protein